MISWLTIKKNLMKDLISKANVRILHMTFYVLWIPEKMLSILCPLKEERSLEDFVGKEEKKLKIGITIAMCLTEFMDILSLKRKLVQNVFQKRKRLFLYH